MKPTARPRADGSPAAADRLVFDVASQLVVEIEFLAVEIERGRADLALGE